MAERIKVEITKAHAVCDKCGNTRRLVKAEQICRPCHSKKYDHSWTKEVDGSQFKYTNKRNWAQALRHFMEACGLQYFKFTQLPKELQDMRCFRATVERGDIVKHTRDTKRNNNVNVWKLKTWLLSTQKNADFSLPSGNAHYATAILILRFKGKMPTESAYVF